MLQVDLHQCVPLLNLIDAEFEKIINIGKDVLFPCESQNCVVTDSSEDIGPAMRLENFDANELLSFTIHLLRNSINKDAYQSVEVNAMHINCFSCKIFSFETTVVVIFSNGKILYNIPAIAAVYIPFHHLSSKYIDSNILTIYHNSSSLFIYSANSLLTKHLIRPITISFSCLFSVLFSVYSASYSHYHYYYFPFPVYFLSHSIL